MTRLLFINIAIAAIAYLGVCGAMYMAQGSMIYYPQPRTASAADSTMILRNGEAELVVSIKARPGAQAIIYFGGNAEDVSANLESFALAFPDHALFLLHYRSYGGSTGRPSERANHSDALALFRAVHAQHPEVAVIGRSLGSGIAVRLASETPATRLILVTPYDSIEEIAVAAYPYLPIKFLLRDRYQSWKYAPSIKIPTSLSAAEQDQVIPRASSEKLLSRFSKGIASMTVIRGVGHNNLGSTDEYLETMRTALQ